MDFLDNFKIYIENLTIYFNTLVNYVYYLFGLNLFNLYNPIGLEKKKISTPEEEINEKINKEDFEAVREIGLKHNINLDPIYQSQWSNNLITIETITNYLSNITVKNWVLDQCLGKVAHDFESMYALLEYGLKITDLNEIFNFNEQDISVEDLHNLSYDDYLIKVQDRINKNKEQFILNSLLNFTPEQNFFLTSRFKLLNYKEKLQIFEKITLAENEHCESIKFNFEKYKDFRDKSYLEIAIDYAHENGWRAIKVLFTYAGNYTLIHRLPILNNFPETLSPLNYQILFPICSPNINEEFCYKWEEIEIEKEDWCYKYCNNFLKTNLEDEFETKFYFTNVELNEFKGKNLSRNLLEKWYIRRVREIEELSSLVNNSLTLLSIGIKNNIHNLEKLKQDMEIYHTLIYECLPRYNLNDITFSEFEKFSIKKKIDLFMCKAVDKSENFVECFKVFLIPFLEKSCEPKSKVYFLLLHQYIISISSFDLNLCYLLFKHYLQNDEIDEKIFIEDCKSIFENIDTMVNLLIDCIYSNNETNRLSIAYNLIDCLPKNINLNENTKKKLNLLKSHLIVVEYLSCYEYLVSAVYIKNLQETENVDEIKKIYVSISKFAIQNLTIPIDLNSLHTILNDLHEMTQICFNQFLNLDEINYLFVKVLLLSEKKEIILLTKEFLTLDKNIIPNSKSLSYNDSIKIIHDCAVDYVNRADSTKDEIIDLTKICLKLCFNNCEEYPYIIKKELDFIEALYILNNNFDLQLLPIQIRLFPDPKIDVIKIALSSFPNAYKNVNDILKLANLLYIYENKNKDYVEAKILSLVGEYAIKNNDFKECYYICKIIMDNNYELGWEICKKLALISNYSDQDSKYNLLCFALTNAPDDGSEINNIINQITKLKISFNENTTNKSFSDLIINKTHDVSDLILNKTQAVAQVTSNLSKWLIQNVIKEDENLRIAKEYERIDKEIEMENKNKPIVNSINIPAFYLDAFEDYENFKIKTNDLDIDYNHYILSEINTHALPFSVGQLFLRKILLQSDLEFDFEGQKKINDFLQELAYSALFHDTPLAFNYLKCLNDYELVENVFNKLSSKSPILIYIALYFYSIEFLKEINLKYDLESNSMKDTISKVQVYMADKKIKNLNELIEKYKKLFNDLIKADTLLSFYTEIDVNRFINDEIYKKETLFGLAMTEDDQTLKDVLNLAIQYNVHFFEIYLNYVEYLLTSSTMDLEEMVKKIFDNIDLMSALIENYDVVTIVFKERIYPLINGKDYPRLLLYFNILKKINNDDQEKKLIFINHFKALKKLCKIIDKPPYLDYKQLVEMNKPFVELFYPILNESNFNLIARWTITLKLDYKENSSILNSSAIYSIWLRKVFIMNKPKWQVTYENNIEIINKLNSKDYLYFMNFYLLSPDAQAFISDINERFYYLESALEYVKKKLLKCKTEEKLLWNQVDEELKKFNFYN